MMDLTPYQGIGQFGPAYRAMMERDAHAPGSVDRVLVERMVRLCAATAQALYAEFTPTRAGYVRGSRPELEAHLAPALAGRATEEAPIEAVARFCAALAERATSDLDALRIGGTEEEIIARGSDWCTDVARVGCALAQVAGFPARIVCLFDLARAYSGHVIIEVFRSGTWGAVDTSAAVVYRHPDGRPATTWEIMNHPRLVEEHAKSPSAFYTTAGQFRAAAVTDYAVADRAQYDYTTSGVNDYYRSILEMSARGWPGGLRWLHDENRREEPPHVPR